MIFSAVIVTVLWNYSSNPLSVKEPEMSGIGMLFAVRTGGSTDCCNEKPCDPNTDVGTVLCRELIPKQFTGKKHQCCYAFARSLC